MTFVEAIDALKQGYTIRRKAWHPDITVYPNKRGTRAIIDFGDGRRIGPWVVLESDKEASDYEIDDVVVN